MDVLIEKAPYIAAIVLVIVVFLAYLGKEGKRRDAFDIARMKELERIGQACHEHTRELNERFAKAMDNSARIIEVNTKIIGAIERRMNGPT